MLSAGVGLVTGSLYVFFDSVILLLELYSSEILAFEYIFAPDLFEKGENEN